jgi:rfaE bifunctional protein nucleotidyltransferase chain/domain
MQHKIKSQEELSEIVERIKQEDKTIVTTNGSFDILHSAHANLLHQAKQEGDILIVLLNSDSSIKKNKGPTRPVIPQDERAKMLSALESTDYIIIFEEDTPLKLLELIKPDKHVKGGSFIESRINEEKSLLESWDGKFIPLPLEQGLSTTNIIDNILKSNTKN